MKKYRGIIFDMDGTLIHSTEADFQAWRRVCLDYDLDLTWDKYFPLLGMKSVDFVAQFMKVEEKLFSSILQAKAEYFDAYVEETGIELLAKVDILLAQLKEQGYKIALATSSRRYKADSVLNRLSLLQFFDVITTGEEVHNSKPAPDIFLLAASRLQIDPAECIVFEDAANGVIAAKTAGAFTIAITSTHKKEQLAAADLIISDYTELLGRNLNVFLQNKVV
ncbi:HAD family hydrolase [Gynurincola endophyticus]|uniref:HAD family hydrolase n=1 Tax=Gynurincola endophyticus TaxID=2479004 RepID=UPI000F8D7DAF|nr:HAD family phosphatase [Gynurincola endophyticus]